MNAHNGPGSIGLRKTSRLIAHCHSFLFLLRAARTKDGWVDTSEWEELWDDDAYYAHLDDLDFA